ncbi:hypothetical protein Dimus_009125 [Dionaea muscipula]
METTAPFFHEFKKQASFYIKEKIKTARLALTDVTPAQLLTEEATNGNPWAPDTRSLGLISRAAFEVDDYWRIVDILHHKLLRFDRKNWRPSYKALIVLEHLMTQGPESVAHEFQCDQLVIREMQNFQHVDEKGFNWGLAVRKKAERVAEMLERGPVLKEERNRARSVTRGIQGFGSFSEKRPSSSPHESDYYGRSHSQFNEHGNEEEGADGRDHALIALQDMMGRRPNQINSNVSIAPPLTTRLKEEETKTCTPGAGGDLHSWNDKEEEEEEEGGFLIRDEEESSNNRRRLLVEEEEDHPFYNKSEKQSSRSLLAAGDHM